MRASDKPGPPKDDEPPLSADDVVLLEDDAPQLIEGSLMPPAMVAEAERAEIENEVDSDLEDWMKKNVQLSVPPPPDEESEDEEKFYAQFKKRKDD